MLILVMCSAIGIIKASPVDQLVLLRRTGLVRDRENNKRYFEFPKCTDLRALDLAGQLQEESGLKKQRLCRSYRGYPGHLDKQLLAALKREVNTNCLVPHRPSVRPSTRSAAQTPVSFLVRGKKERFTEAVKNRTVFGVYASCRKPSAPRLEEVDLDDDCCCCMPYFESVVGWIKINWFDSVTDRRNKKEMSE